MGNNSIRVSNKTLEALKRRKHTGQSFDGFLQDLLGIADVVKLADTRTLRVRAARHVGSNPTIGTKHK